MKYQVGDKVLILHSNEQGEITDIINDKMVMVNVRGVNFPVYMDQIDFPYFKQFSSKKLFPHKKDKQYIDDLRKEKTPPHKVVDGVWLSFLPVMDIDEFGDDVVEVLKVHIINRTYHSLKFFYKLHFFGKSEFELKNQVNSFTDFYLHDVPFSDMSDSPSFAFEFSLIQPDKSKVDFYEASLKLKPKQLFDKIEEIKKKGEATFSYRLFETYPDKPEEDKVEFNTLKAKGVKVYDAK